MIGAVIGAIFGSGVIAYTNAGTPNKGSFFAGVLIGFFFAAAGAGIEYIVRSFL